MSVLINRQSDEAGASAASLGLQLAAESSDMLLLSSQAAAFYRVTALV